MAIIAKLSSLLTLDATKFSAGLTKVRSEIGAFSAISLGAFARIGTAITGMVGRGITALPRMTLSGLEMGDALSDSSKMTGIAASRLAVYYRAARLAGVGNEEFNQAIGRMNVNIAEAIAGDEKFASVLARAGVNLKNIADLSPEETFLRLADAISKTESAFDRASTVKQAFGRGGFRFLPMLSGGRAGINEFSQSSLRLGIAPTNQQVSGIEAANDALQDLGSVMLGIKTQLAVELSTTIQGAADSIRVFAENTQLAATVAGTLGDVLRPMIYFWSAVFSGKSADEFFDQNMKAMNQRMDAMAKSRLPKPQEKPAMPLTKEQRDIESQRQYIEKMRAAGIKSTTGAAYADLGKPPKPLRWRRSLHDVILGEMERPVDPGKPFGHRIKQSGFDIAGDTAAGSIPREEQILSELRLIQLEGNLNADQLREQQRMVQLLESIERQRSGMKP